MLRRPVTTGGTPRPAREFRRSRRDGVQVPLAGDALGAVLAAVDELQAGAGDQVADGPRDEHLAGGGQLAHAGGDVDRHARELAVVLLALPGVQAGADTDAALRQGLDDRARAADG